MSAAIYSLGPFGDILLSVRMRYHIDTIGIDMGRVTHDALVKMAHGSGRLARMARLELERRALLDA